MSVHSHMKFWFSLVFTLAIISQDLFSQTAPVVDLYGCSVQSEADIVLRWIPLTSPVGFSSYDIYHAAGSESFSRIASVSNSTVGTWTHTDAASDNIVHRYYILTVTSGNPISPSDTLFSIVPVVTNINDYTADLRWGDYGPEPHPQAEPWFYIYREKGAGSWILIDSTAGNQYTDIPGVCIESVRYRISWRVYNNQNFSQTTIPMEDIAPPLSPSIDSVSADESGQILFGWQQGTSPDTKEYIIFSNYNGIWDTLCRIPSADITSYMESGINAANGPRIFSMASIDLCGNTTADLGIPRLVQTMWMAPVEHHICEHSIELNWTSYVNMPEGLAGYRLMVSTDNGPYLPFDTVGADSLTTSFTNLEHNTLYKFKVVAFNNSEITSSSSVAAIHVLQPKPPQFTYIRYANVEENRKIRLAIVNDSTAQTAGLILQRSDLDQLYFTTVDTLIPQSGLITFADSLVHPTREAYIYRVLALDSCSAAVVESNYSTSVWLRLADPATGLLEWTPHQGFEGGLSHYCIQRRLGGIWQQIGETSNQEIDFTDIEYPELIPLQSLEYRVIAIETAENHYFTADSVFSNIIVALPTYRMFIPTAFSPRSTINQVFKPVMLSVDANDYYFAIFNRFGQRIFESTSTEEGWDGTLNGDRLKSGVYAYYVRILTVTGKYQEERGMVTLVE
ncbi:MAG: hypothetical protein CVU06_01120 [Bacteroidetes bacterium HGW-Bacteroidetes-22]|nr:MAG: hypothetical protein CVU06_01120 [Bacteroidetes bacterium HGW-Bacteroidetes-22]